MFKKDVNNFLTSWTSRYLTFHFQRSHLPVQIADVKWESPCREGKCASSFLQLRSSAPPAGHQNDLSSAYLRKYKSSQSKQNFKKLRHVDKKPKKERYHYVSSGIHVHFGHGRCGTSWPDKLHSQQPFLSLGKRFCTSLQWLWLIQAVVAVRPSENNSKNCLHSSHMFPFLLSYNILHV